MCGSGVIIVSSIEYDHPVWTGSQGQIGSHSVCQFLVLINTFPMMMIEWNGDDILPYQCNVWYRTGSWSISPDQSNLQIIGKVFKT